MISIFDTIEMSKFLPPVSISQNTKAIVVTVTSVST